MRKPTTVLAQFLTAVRQTLEERKTQHQNDKHTSTTQRKMCVTERLKCT